MLRSSCAARRVTSGVAPEINRATGSARLRLPAVAMATRRRNDVVSVGMVSPASGHIATVSYCSALWRHQIVVSSSSSSSSGGLMLIVSDSMLSCTALPSTPNFIIADVKSNVSPYEAFTSTSSNENREMSKNNLPARQVSRESDFSSANSASSAAAECCLNVHGFRWHVNLVTVVLHAMN